MGSRKPLLKTLFCCCLRHCCQVFQIMHSLGHMPVSKHSSSVCIITCWWCQLRKTWGNASWLTPTSPADSALSSTHLWNCFPLSSTLKANCFIQWNKTILEPVYCTGRLLTCESVLSLGLLNVEYLDIINHKEWNNPVKSLTFWMIFVIYFKLSSSLPANILFFLSWYWRYSYAYSWHRN